MYQDELDKKQKGGGDKMWLQEGHDSCAVNNKCHTAGRQKLRSGKTSMADFLIS